MEDFTTTPDPRFPPGTVLALWRAEDHTRRPSSIELGRATVGPSSSATFFQLLDRDRIYVIGTAIGEWRGLRVSTFRKPATIAGLQDRLDDLVLTGGGGESAPPPPIDADATIASLRTLGDAPGQAAEGNRSYTQVVPANDYGPSAVIPIEPLKETVVIQTARLLADTNIEFSGLRPGVTIYANFEGGPGAPAGRGWTPVFSQMPTPLDPFPEGVGARAALAMASLDGESLLSLRAQDSTPAMVVVTAGTYASGS